MSWDEDPFPEIAAQVTRDAADQRASESLAEARALAEWEQEGAAAHAEVTAALDWLMWLADRDRRPWRDRRDPANAITAGLDLEGRRGRSADLVEAIAVARDIVDSHTRWPHPMHVGFLTWRRWARCIPQMRVAHERLVAADAPPRPV